MKGKILLGLLALCLLLPGCRKEAEVPEAPPDPPAIETAQDPPAPTPQPMLLDHLAVEIVVDWEEADRILGSLEDLSRLLEDALEAQDCTVEEPVVITIGTAGGITAQALQDGGIDAAFLPEADFTELGDKAAEILESPANGLVAAVSGARAELGPEFRHALAEALTETESGRTFLETCYPGAAFTALSPSVPG